jgi:hypothetical protein
MGEYVKDKLVTFIRLVCEIIKLLFLCAVYCFMFVLQAVADD